jgi:probable phosphoglycerate mutase
MTDLLLIRHGRTFWNSEGRFQGQLNSDLNEIGQVQVAALGKRFDGQPLDHVYSSDLGRAWQTARALTQSHSLEVQAEVSLRERCMGVFEGSTQPEIQAASPDAWKYFVARDPSYQIPEGESINDVLFRSNEFLEHIAQNHVGQRIAAVTHGGWIRVVLKGLLGMDQKLATRFKVFNTSIHHLKFVEGHWWVMGMGDVSHVDESLLQTSVSYAL